MNATNYQPTYDLLTLSGALDAYQVAQRLADERGETDVWCAARAGEVLARVGRVAVRVWEKEQERTGEGRDEGREMRTLRSVRKVKTDEIAKEEEDEDRMSVVSEGSDASEYEDDDEDTGSSVDSDLEEVDGGHLAVGEDILSEWDRIESLSNELLEVAEGYGGTMIALSHLISAILLNPPFQHSSRTRPSSSSLEKPCDRSSKTRMSLSPEPCSSPSKLASTPSSTHLLKFKSHLRIALQLATVSSDNYLRALFLAFIGSHFVYTAPKEAVGMFDVVEQLGSRLRASPKVPTAAQDASASDEARNGHLTKGESNRGKQQVSQEAPGNLPLRLYAGKKVLEIYRRAEGEEAEQKMRKQELFLEELVRAGAKSEMDLAV
jgi:hypothetical protein